MWRLSVEQKDICVSMPVADQHARIGLNSIYVYSMEE